MTNRKVNKSAWLRNAVMVACELQRLGINLPLEEWKKMPTPKEGWAFVLTVKRDGDKTYFDSKNVLHSQSGWGAEERPASDSDRVRLVGTWCRHITETL